jgi:hypothetical protein
MYQRHHTLSSNAGIKDCGAVFPLPQYVLMTGHGGHIVQGMNCPRLLTHRGRGFESHSEHAIIMQRPFTCTTRAKGAVSISDQVTDTNECLEPSCGKRAANRRVRLETSSPPLSRLCKEYGNLDGSQSLSPAWPVTHIALPFVCLLHLADLETFAFLSVLSSRSVSHLDSSNIHSIQFNHSNWITIKGSITVTEFM